MPYQLAVLDFDGVILNSEPYHFYIRESLLAEYCAGAQYDPVTASESPYPNSMQKCSDVPEPIPISRSARSNLQKCILSGF